MTVVSPFLRKEEAADYLNVSIDYLDELRLKGEGPAVYKLGGFLYKIEDLDSWLKEELVTPRKVIEEAIEAALTSGVSKEYMLHAVEIIYGKVVPQKRVRRLVDRMIEGWIYVIKLEDGSVKIGHTTRSVEIGSNRLKELAHQFGGEVQEILKVVDGSVKEEKSLHKKFEHLRFKHPCGMTEFFKRTPEIDAWLQGLDQ